MQKEARR